MTKLPELSAAVALGWSLLVTLSLASVGIVAGSLFGNTNQALIAGGVGELLLLLPAAHFIGRVYGGPDRDRALGKLGVAPLELLIAGSLGLLLQAPMGYLIGLVETRFPTPRQELEAQLQQLTPQTPLLGALMFVIVALVAPYIEELFFRGALLTQLLRSGPAFVGIWTTALAFTLAHAGQPRHWPALFVLALVLGELRRQSGSIWAGVALHAGFNATTLLFVFFERPSRLESPDMPWHVAALGGLLSVLGLWLFRRVSARRLREGA